MEFDPWHHWVWLRPLFILLLIALVIAVSAVVGWFKRRREKLATLITTSNRLGT